MLLDTMPQLPQDLFGREQLLLMLDGLRPVPVADAMAVREAAEDAVRGYTSAERLAANPLARGASAAKRVASMRALVDRAVDHVFGSAYTDVGVREVLTAGYLVAGMPHEAVADALYLSRSTYFRRLAAGLQRVADHIAADYAASARASAPLERMFSLS